MHYEIDLKSKTYNQDGDWYHFSDSILPFMYNETLIEGMRSEFLDKTGVCKDCHDMCYRCHVMVPVDPEDPYSPLFKLCPVMFHDVFKTKWKLTDIV